MLLEWAEVACYSHFSSGMGARECPFFLAQYVCASCADRDAEAADAARGG